MYQYTRLLLKITPQLGERARKRRLEFLEKAAKAGHTQAQFDLARYFTVGSKSWLVPQDSSKALSYAEMITPEAYKAFSEADQKKLIDALQDGECIRRASGLARWFRRAFAAGLGVEMVYGER